MKSKKLLMVILVVIFVIGVASVYAQWKDVNSQHGFNDWKGDGNHMNNHCGGKNSWSKGYVGSDENKAGHYKIMRDKFGLSEDATDQEVFDAMHEWMGNKKSFDHKRIGFHKGNWHKDS
jgi:hypothetical protein|tara:strand:- start:16907 stop:17263 length:357 start_codon:yes stop_codon:yes gene_type:complete